MPMTCRHPAVQHLAPLAGRGWNRRAFARGTSEKQQLFEL
jgi:hypothetical protein